MPFWNRQSNPSDYLPPTETKKEETHPPKYVDEARFNESIEQIKALGTQFSQFTGMFTSMMGQGQSQDPAPTQPVKREEIPDISDAEYEDAIFKGDAAKIAIRTNAIAARAVQNATSAWETRFNELEQRGMGALDSLSTEITQGALNTMPYYQILKKDIDSALATLPPHQRTPAMREHVYHAVVGKNLDKVRAHDAAESVRLSQERESTTTPNRTSTRQTGPTPESVFGESILSPQATWKGGASLWSRRSPEQWTASRYGTSNLQEAATYVTNVMAISDCRQCFSPVVAGKCHCPAQR